MENILISEFSYILLFIVGAIVFIAGGLITAWIIRPSRPNDEKKTSYECGEDPVGNAWGQFNIRFYIVALIFILFDVEIIFLFPWATVFGQQTLVETTSGVWGWFAITEMSIFIFILTLGLVYAWKKGYLDWVKPLPKTEDFNSKVPYSLYEKVNQKYTVPSSKPE
ncbi:NADH-quinone oxidoreductase subunit A [Flexithrix dorotheae]|uniref:NADH-quinone oxidoreductase subunit A n=1 Tax=Flexithrix dorotheae TaxID=70993 RepID=UPI0003612A2A|nr:NADH-quinone oxidoreductase subunit A [Flexithrix dorotheae]